MDSFDFRPMSQYIFDFWIFSCLRLVIMCFDQFNLLSRCMPRYFTSDTLGILTPFSDTAGHVLFFSVKVTCADFVSLALTRHDFSQIWMLFRWSCSSLEAVFGFMCVERIAVSSFRMILVGRGIKKN